jgi:hypothetical protein
MSKIRYCCTVRDIEGCESDGAATPIFGRIIDQHDEMTEQPFARNQLNLHNYSASVLSKTNEQKSSVVVTITTH